jgi:hypothetical protein
MNEQREVYGLWIGSKRYLTFDRMFIMAYNMRQNKPHLLQRRTLSFKDTPIQKSKNPSSGTHLNITFSSKPHTTISDLQTLEI